MVISQMSLFLKYFISIDAIALDYRVNLPVLYQHWQSSQNSIIRWWKQCVLSTCLDARRSGANASEKSAASAALLFLHARSDGLDDRRSHLEGSVPVFDAVPARNPIKIRINRPDIAIRILTDQ